MNEAPDDTTPGNTEDQKMNKGDAGSESERLLEEAFRANRDRKQRDRASIDALKASLTDKEVFDIHAFDALYSARSGSGELIIDPAVIQEFEVEYYLKNPHLKTLQEFAEYRTNLDRHDSN